LFSCAGHEWCHQNLGGYKPNSGWAVDPFGYSPTMAYILRRAGLDNMLIQRTHYNIKKKFAQVQPSQWHVLVVVKSFTGTIFLN
jgi:hypothetical protein